MENWKSVDEVLDFAIRNEEEAAAMYIDLAGRVENKALKTVFEGFAREEEGHKRKLLEVKSGGGFAPSREKVADLKIADYLVDVDPTEKLDYQKALILAMKREKAAYKLYTRLAAITEDVFLENLFNALAQEEAKHKLRFELEYDDQILSEN
jgi:rubrerythrin